MKIRTDFVTNSSSSSFVAYSLTNSAFCRYLHELSEKYGHCLLDVDHWADNERCPNITLDEESLYAEFAHGNLYLDNTAPEAEGDEYDYTEAMKEADSDEVQGSFEGYLENYLDYSSIEEDEDKKLWDAFIDDLENNRFHYDFYMGTTD